MKILNGICELLEPLPQSVMTIGNFDGIHLGHRKLLSQLMCFSKKLQMPSVVMVFHPHPRLVLSSYSSPPFYPLFDQQDQEDILRQIGIDYLIREPFSKQLAKKAAHIFFQEWIYKSFCPQVIVVGHDFVFGYKRTGNLTKLKSMASDRQISIQIVPPVTLNNQVVASTYIRQALLNNDVTIAAKFLGRPFYLRGYLQKDHTKKRGVYTFQSQRKTPLKGIFKTKVFLKDHSYIPSLTTINDQKNIFVKIDTSYNLADCQEIQLQFMAKQKV